jgi:hypothetical protein
MVGVRLSKEQGTQPDCLGHVQAAVHRARRIGAEDHESLFLIANRVTLRLIALQRCDLEHSGDAREFGGIRGNDQSEGTAGRRHTGETRFDESLAAGREGLVYLRRRKAHRRYGVIVRKVNRRIGRGSKATQSQGYSEDFDQVD